MCCHVVCLRTIMEADTISTPWKHQPLCLLKLIKPSQSAPLKRAPGFVPKRYEDITIGTLARENSCLCSQRG